MKQIKFAIFAALILFFPGRSIVLNTWELLHLRLPLYHINPYFLSGTLLLFDRPMFFESRQIQIKEKGQQDSLKLEFNLETPGFNSYIKRRLFRMAFSKFPCGSDEKAAFESIFCNSTLEILKDRHIEEVQIVYTPHFHYGKESLFQYRCEYAQ